MNTIACAYTILEREVHAASDFESLRKSHDNFIATLVSRCYLNSKTMRTAINQVLACCSRISDKIASVENITSLTKDQISSFSKEFDKCSSYLFTVLQKTNAQDLIHHLDFNSVFSQTASNLLPT